MESHTSPNTRSNSPFDGASIAKERSTLQRTPSQLANNDYPQQCIRRRRWLQYYKSSNRSAASAPRAEGSPWQGADLHLVGKHALRKCLYFIFRHTTALPILPSLWVQPRQKSPFLWSKNIQPNGITSFCFLANKSHGTNRAIK